MLYQDLPHSQSAYVFFTLVYLGYRRGVLFRLRPRKPMHVSKIALILVEETLPVTCTPLLVV